MSDSKLSAVSIHPETMTDPQMNALIEEYNAVVNRIAAPLYDLYMDKWTVEIYQGSKNPSTTYICFTNPYSAICMPTIPHMWMDIAKINLSAISKLVDDINAGAFIDEGVVYSETNKDADIAGEVIIKTSNIHEGQYIVNITKYMNKYIEFEFCIKKDKLCELLAYIYTMASPPII